MSKVGRTKDPVWEHFEKVGTQAKCLNCGHVQSAKACRMNNHVARCLQNNPRNSEESGQEEWNGAPASLQRQTCTEPLSMCEVHSSGSESERNTSISTRKVTKRTNKFAQDVLKTTNVQNYKHPRVADDRFDIFGKCIAAKLRDLPKQQRILAEKIINETISLAELNNLTISHCVNNILIE